MVTIFSMIIFSLFTGALSAGEIREAKVQPKLEIQRLLKNHDIDRDQKITIKDNKKGKILEFSLRTKDIGELPVNGVYPLSNLLQELKLAEEEKREWINGTRILENPVRRLSRVIKDRFWDSLTRKIDREHLKEVLIDSKIKTKGAKYLFVPYEDLEALEYYLEASAEMPELKVVRLPERITPEYVHGLKGQHGLLTLALQKNEQGKIEGVPYVVPGGRFNEMYGWDSYFESLGLIVDGRVDLARAMVDNFVYQITHYGKILNANRSYYLTRSQPPFLTSMIRAVLESLPKNKETQEWLAKSHRAAIKEYHTVWMGEERLTSTGLSRYYGYAPGIPPEVEPNHFDPVIRPYAKKHGLGLASFKKKFDQGKIKEPELEAFFMHDRAVRESGHDTTYRWRDGGKDKCADFVTVDLNSLLYKFELDLAFLIRKHFNGEFDNLKSSAFWELARKRKERILQYLWDPEKEMFFDYNHVTKSRSSYVSATALYPLWAHHPEFPETRILDQVEADRLIKNSLSQLEAAGGIAATSATSLRLYGDKKHARQWEWPNGWAPHQMIIWEGLKSYGHESDSLRLTYKWLYMITKNAMDYNGTVPEKYDVQERSHAVFAEYGNVGTDFSYITREGFGWMNASYQVGLKSLSPALLKHLESVTPPEWLQFQ